MLKDLGCGELTAKDVGRKLQLAGWVHRRRDHGGLIFIDLRDVSGLVQVVFDPNDGPAAHTVAEAARNEWVLAIAGTVRKRPEGTENPAMATGQVEVLADVCQVLNESKTPPFYINEESEVDESLRLKYRYLDLRRPEMQRNIILRHRVIKFIRDFLDERGFLEIETPILLKSTPEGARDYVVPSRVHPGQFYALPQSPQQLKQLLMVAGYERYFQIARCFRDEDLRADRQPEFTQLDLEMSFVETEDLLQLIEELFVTLVAAEAPHFSVETPFPRLTFNQAMERFGTDKPDMRFGMELHDVSHEVEQTDFNVFKSAVAAGGVVKGIAVPGGAAFPRREIDLLGEVARELGAKGLAWIAVGKDAMDGADLDDLTEEDIRSPIAKFIPSPTLLGIARELESKPGDLLLFVADTREVACDVLGRLRTQLGHSLGLPDPNRLAFVHVVDFPLVVWKEEEQRWDAVHHPFTSPQVRDIPLLQSDPGKVRAAAYDLACNGWELAGGSIRIHRRPLQEQIFKLMGYSREEVGERFGHLVEAFEYGAPPHGGFASGIDRTVMVLAGEDNIREVIPFPKTASASDLMVGAPAPLDEAQLRELGLRVRDEPASP